MTSLLRKGGAPMAQQKSKPKYRVLADRLLEEILSGKRRYFDQLPTEHSLMAEYNLSRITVRQALALLESKGYIRRTQGKGSFVSYKKTQMQLNALLGFSEEMLQKGLTPSTRILEITRREAGSQIAPRLQIGAQEEIYRLVRLRLADDKPMCIESLHVPSALCPNLERERIDGSVYSIFRDIYGYVLRYAEQEIEAGAANAWEAAHLDVAQGVPSLIALRTTYLDGDKPLEFVSSVYRGDRYRITARLEYAL